ncbi:hypothetical protein [Gemmiger formicilis]|uniref:hypothetical protein n=1 Tax=Gemmiger formicilis TaxID=745368 RepID=UPI003991D1D7
MIKIAANRKASKPPDSPGLDQTQTAHSQTSADTPRPGVQVRADGAAVMDTDGQECKEGCEGEREEDG